jgi:hypothetical protein
LIEEVRSGFDVVIIDVPADDTFLLAPKVDGVILTYAVERVGRDALRRARLRIESAGGKVWGVILNNIESEINDTRDSSPSRLRQEANPGRQKTVRHRKLFVVPPASERDPGGFCDVKDIMALTDKELI